MGDQQVAQSQEPWSASIVATGATVSGAYEKLTSRELQVALGVAEGRSNRDIASRLFISQKTVEFHLSNVFGKLGVNSRTQLALALIRMPSQSSSGQGGRLNLPSDSRSKAGGPSIARRHRGSGSTRHVRGARLHSRLLDDRRAQAPRSPFEGRDQSKVTPP